MTAEFYSFYFLMQLHFSNTSCTIREVSMNHSQPFYSLDTLGNCILSPDPTAKILVLTLYRNSTKNLILIHGATTAE